VAIGRFVMRTKQHLVALRPLDGVLTLHTLYYADELVDRADLEGVPGRSAVGKKELEAASRLIDSLTTDWDPGRYHDTYREEVLDMVHRKAEGEDVVTEAPKEHKAEVLDLMAALEASLAGRKGGGRSAGASGKPAAKATKASKATKATKATKAGKAAKKPSSSKSASSKTASSKTTSAKRTSSKKSSSSKPAKKAARKPARRARKSA
jgi:DNA end-binding protein Ku